MIDTAFVDRLVRTHVGGSRRPGVNSALLMSAIVLAGCSGAASPSATVVGSSAATAGVPNPFHISARFEPSSLGLNHAIALAVGPDGNLYVTDITPAVVVISPDGEPIGRWGKLGTGPGEFTWWNESGDPLSPDQSASIAIGPDGKVYVSDSDNARVEVFSPTGDFIRQFGRQGEGDGQFRIPTEIAIDESGSAYVADDFDRARSVSKFSSSGDFAWRIGGPTALDPELRGPKHLAGVDSQGRVVMTNEARILYIDPSGTKVDAFGTPADFPGGACSLSVNDLDEVFVTSCTLAVTQVFDRSHELIAGWYGAENTLSFSPRFGPSGAGFALSGDGAILKLQVTLATP